MDTKHWWESMTLWGAIIVVAGLALRLLGRPQEAEAIEQESEAITAWIAEALTLIGAALAFIGRIRARTQLIK